MVPIRSRGLVSRSKPEIGQEMCVKTSGCASLQWQVKKASKGGIYYTMVLEPVWRGRSRI